MELLPTDHIHWTQHLAKIRPTIWGVACVGLISNAVRAGSCRQSTPVINELQHLLVCPTGWACANGCACSPHASVIAAATGQAAYSKNMSLIHIVS